MTATKAAAEPSTYRSGHCSAGFHDRCRGTYAGVACTCPHHTELEPEPEVLGQIAAALTDLGTAAAVEQHCRTCSCGSPA